MSVHGGAGTAARQRENMCRASLFGLACQLQWVGNPRVESVNLQLFSLTICLTHALGNYSFYISYLSASLSSIPVIVREAFLLLHVAGCDFPRMQPLLVHEASWCVRVYVCACVRVHTGMGIHMHVFGCAL